MFFEREDIDSFKRNAIYTKKGLKGKIKSGLGTHGLMKCVFNGVVNQSDVVCMDFYKRVFPKCSYLY